MNEQGKHVASLFVEVILMHTNIWALKKIYIYIFKYQIPLQVIQNFYQVSICMRIYQLWFKTTKQQRSPIQHRYIQKAFVASAFLSILPTPQTPLEPTYLSRLFELCHEREGNLTTPSCFPFNHRNCCSSNNSLGWATSPDKLPPPTLGSQTTCTHQLWVDRGSQDLRSGGRTQYVLQQVRHFLWVWQQVLQVHCARRICHRAMTWR